MLIKHYLVVPVMYKECNYKSFGWAYLGQNEREEEMSWLIGIKNTHYMFIKEFRVAS